MKTILCYGDSNTFGFIPENAMRYPEHVRWTGVLQHELGNEYNIIEEGCNGRTTVYDDPCEEWKNGKTYIKPCLNSHKPIDVIILMLGSNDMKVVFNATAEDAANGVSEIINIIKEFTKNKQGYVPKIILVSPPHISPIAIGGCFGNDFDEKSCSESKLFSRFYGEAAKNTDSVFVDAAKLVEPSGVDGLHLSIESHKILGVALAEVVKNISI